MSGGTLIALAADEILMSPNAVLGPLDPQLSGFPAPSLLRLKTLKDPNRISDEFLIMADMAAKAVNQLKEVIVELLEEKMGKAQAQQLAAQLTEGHWTHDYPITPLKAKEMGLPVTTDVPKEFLRLMALYRQPVQRQSAVEYLQQNELHFRLPR
jgi:ClpP class serine protease